MLFRSECRAALGERPGSAAECASGFLVDGVCCKTESCAPCYTCDAEKKETPEYPGQCGAIRAGKDPYSQCNEDATATCGLNGACDGSGRCQKYKRGTGCGTFLCVSGNRVTGRICPGVGMCAEDPVGVECTPYACLTNLGCAAKCTTNAECAPLHRCVDQRCIPDQGTICEDPRTLVSAAGVRTDCAPYRCDGAACRTACETNSDCADDADCTSNQKCVPFIAEPNIASGCRASRGRGDSGYGLVALAAAAVLRARRRRARR